jgi:hypothetical protein
MKFKLIIIGYIILILDAIDMIFLRNYQVGMFLSAIAVCIFFTSFFFPLEEVSPKINRLIGHLICKHNYELLNQFEMKSEFDIVQEHGKVPNTHNSQTRKVVTDYKCTKCQKIKRFVEKTSR